MSRLVDINDLHVPDAVKTKAGRRRLHIMEQDGNGDVPPQVVGLPNRKRKRGQTNLQGLSTHP